VVKLPLNNSTIFRIEVYNQFGAVLHTFGFVAAVSLIQEFRFDFDFSLNINSGDRLFIYVRKVNGGSGPNGNFLTFNSDGEFLLSYNSVSVPSNCKGIKIYSLYRRIMARVAPTAQIDSYLLKNEWIKDLILISGNAIRELSTAVITISFKDFFDACNAWESVGFGSENNIYKLEKLPFFFRPVKMIAETLSVSKCNFTVDVEGLFSSIEIGYNDGNTDDTDGQYEYNSGQEWKMPQSVVSKKQNFKSPIRADQYGIEKLNGSKWYHTPGIGLENNWKKLAIGKDQALVNKLSIESRELYNQSDRTLRDGVEELVAAIKDKGWQTGLATESHWINLENILESLDMTLAFDVVTTGDEIFYHKPDPEIYNLTMQKMGLEPQEVMVIEDSVAGVESAVEAGVEVIGIANEFFGETELKAAGAKLVVDNFSEVMVLLPNHGN